MSRTILPRIRSLPGVVLWLLAAALASMWAVRIFAPGQVALLPAAASRPSVSDIDMARPFSATGADQSARGLRLTGVFSHRNGGFATFMTPQGAVSARVGEAVLPGLTLARVGKREAFLVDAGSNRSSRLELTGE